MGRVGKLVFTFTLFLTLRSEASAGFVFLADSVSGDAGTQILVPIRAIDFDSIISIQGTVGFDSSKMVYLGVQNFGLPSMSGANFGTAYAGNGKITFSWNESSLLPISVPDSTVLFALLLQVTGAPGDQVSIPILGAPTLLEVVDWSFTPIPFSTRGGNVSINVPPVCALPDSLAASQVGMFNAELAWFSQNPGANYFVEWGPWGFSQGNGMGTGTGVSIQGYNSILVTNLLPGNTYEFYVQERCDSLTTVDAGPAGFATAPLPPVHATVILFGDSVQGHPHDIVSTGIHALHFTDIVSAQGSVEWDPAVADFQGVMNMGLPGMTAGNFGTSQVGQGKLTFSWNDAGLQGVSIADSALLFELEFHLIGNGGMSCNLGLPDQPLAMEIVDTSLNAVPDSAVNGFIAIVDTLTAVALPQELALEFHPNPIRQAQQQFILNPSFPIAEVLNLHLFRLNGQELHGFQWQAKSNHLECTIETPLPAGIYFLGMETPAGMLYGKLLISRD